MNNALMIVAMSGILILVLFAVWHIIVLLHPETCTWYPPARSYWCR